jgi:phosphatidylglycerophosphatase A
MKDQNIQQPSGLSVLFLSWFYTGKFPKAPGTVGSIATLPLIIALHTYKVSLIYLVVLILVLYAAAVIVTERIQQKYHLHDPQWIVIDEVIGMLITWSFVLRIDFPSLFLVTGLFRFFDIVKIWPASFFDRHLHGFGTITDDVVSGLYAGVLCWLITSYV